MINNFCYLYEPFCLGHRPPGHVLQARVMRAVHPVQGGLRLDEHDDVEIWSVPVDGFNLSSLADCGRGMLADVMIIYAYPPGLL